MDLFKTFSSSNGGLSGIGGKWRGYYEQETEKFSIEAFLEQTDTKVIGSMRDFDRERRAPLLDYARQLALSEEEERRLVSQIAGPFGDPPPSEISVAQILPERSRLIGAIVDREVYLQKTYEAPTVLRIEFGHRRGESRLTPQPVHYEGILSQDRSSITGVWTIEGSENEVIDKGRFELHRA